MHSTRSQIPRNWPVPRKGTKYVVIASHARKIGIPLRVVLRDILKLARTAKEAKYIIANKEVKINNKIRWDEKFPVRVFDIVSIDKLGKNYRMEISNRKFILKEISAREADKKIVKIVGKKMLGDKKIQMSLEDGTNFISKEKFSCGDSAVMNLKENKVDKILGLKTGAKIEVVSGKHMGKKGKLDEIIEHGREKMFKIKINDEEAVLPMRTILVIE